MSRDIQRIGIVGGGQLGRMLAQPAIEMGFEVWVTNPGENGPAAQVGAHEIVAPLHDTDAIDELADNTDVLTWEIEHIPAQHLMKLANNGVDVQPSPSTLHTIQDKLTQKDMLWQAGIPVAPYAPNIIGAEEELGGGPYVVKTRMSGYDGRGNVATNDLADLRISGKLDGPLYVEKAVDFDRELSVIAARGASGIPVLYPVIETGHVDSQCHTTIAPAQIPRSVEKQAIDLAHDTMRVLHGSGVFAMEMFQVGDDVMINEIAPRVHNSGHWTIEGAVTSQFEQHIRAITGLPLGYTDMRAASAVMVNILGRTDEEQARYEDKASLQPAGLAAAMRMVDTHLHLYGKESKPQRKIGHITALSDELAIAMMAASSARDRMPI